MRRGRRAAIAALAVLATTSAMVAVAPAGIASDPTITQVVGGLNSPRGITFDHRGNMYVSESGVPGAGQFGLNRTGRVDKFRAGSWKKAWSTKFQTLFATEDPSAPPDVLGPEGLSSFSGRCEEEEDHCGGIRLIMSESEKGIAAASNGALDADQAGRLYLLDTHEGDAHLLANVGDQDYKYTAAHTDLFPSDFPDSNPYGVLVIPGRHGHPRTFVADAGSNLIVEVLPNGKVRNVAYIPNETSAPFRDATPTCIAQGPDGWLYVGTLHLVANFGAPGQSQVYRVNPNASIGTPPTVWATGLTAVTSCTFDKWGNFWATEMFQPNTNAAPGDVVRIPWSSPTTLDRMGGGQLPLPSGIAQGRDGAIYVNINAAGAPGTGAVMRIEP